MPTPLFDSLDVMIDKLEEGLEHRASKLIARVDAVNERADVTFKRLHAQQDGHDVRLTALNAKLDKLELRNNPLPVSKEPLQEPIVDTAPVEEEPQEEQEPKVRKAF